MSDHPKIARLEARINEITARPTYASTPAWRQEVAELRLQIEALRSGRNVERKEYQRIEVNTGTGSGAAVAAALHADDLGTGAHDEIEAELHAEHHANYVGIWIALLVMTVLEWKFAAWFGVTGVPLWIALGTMAIVKAVMVALYFMHLVFERRTIYALLTLPVVLVFVMMILLSPDAQQHVWDWIYIGR